MVLGFRWFKSAKNGGFGEMLYTIIRADGNEECLGELSQYPNLKFLQDVVGGYIDLVTFPNGDKMYVNDEGKLNGLPTNHKASAIFQKLYPVTEYPMNNDGWIVGDVLYIQRKKPESK